MRLIKQLACLFCSSILMYPALRGQCPDIGEIKTGNDQCIKYTWNNSDDQPASLPNPITVVTNTGPLTFNLKSATSTEAIYQLQGVNGNPCTGGGYGMPQGSSLFPHSTTFDGTSCSFTADGSSDNLLPIHLTDFRLNMSSTGIDLLWKVAIENSSDFYVVERSSDGLEFKEIGILPRQENNSGGYHYIFKDYAPLLGNNYYRLAQRDFDGQWSYSHTLSQEVIASREEHIQLRRYESLLEIRSDFDHGDIIISSMAGVRTHQSYMQQGLKEVDISDFPAGIYAIQIISGDKRRTAKLIVQ